MCDFITDNFCKVCDTRVKNKEAHLKTKKHMKNVNECNQILSFGNMLETMDLKKPTAEKIDHLIALSKKW